MGDIPTGLLEDIRYNPKTRMIAFTSKLTTGQHFCKIHKDLPSRDLFSFGGKLSNASMSGVLKRSDALHPGNPPTEEVIEVRRAKDFHDRFVVLDGARCVHIGASINGAGKTAFMISAVEDPANRGALLQQIESSWSAATSPP